MGLRQSDQYPDNFPWDLAEKAAYQVWRTAKLAQAAELLEKPGPVEIADLASLSTSEHDELFHRCEISNAVFYRDMQKTGDPERLGKKLRHFAEALGLSIAERHRSAGNEGIVSLQVSDSARQKGYIPYSQKPMNWHTDGYYNAPDQKIRAMVLHCARAAKTGGVNQFLDPEIAYIRLRDENPEFITALMHPHAMTIPENRESDGKTRPASIGPVFESDPETDRLVMRYTARTRSIKWRDDAMTKAACTFLTQLLASDEPFIQTVRMQAGVGVLCNNSLHNRTSFDADMAQSSERLMMRVRFHNRVKGR